ncbi:arylamine N-acetyltransferase [Croceibacterium sp. LX-88]|uniref:Arylamine N-acetyltransferase n=1 Tax=Croceibacterium selenioxidans TaxID=2838833 RepID=A0ABS5W7U3_9SPHN|nr:arylamine N-acetyltransferase [Croceibacterium selenioxidans]
MDSRLAAYLERIGLAAIPSPDAVGLEALLVAHREAIAFENLDIPLGRPIAIDSDSVFAKLVTNRRGGYCFEQNRLLADMLELLGLPSRPLLARVRLGAAHGDHPPRTHVLLLIEIEGSPWIADAGFGGSYVPALPLAVGAPADTADGARHRLRRVGELGSLAGEWLLERAGAHDTTDGRAHPHEDWQPQYSFDLAQVAPDDLVQANHWTSTAPTSRFTSLCVATRVLPGGFAGLTDRALRISGGKSEAREIPDAQAYVETLRETFGLELPIEAIERWPIFAT